MYRNFVEKVTEEQDNMKFELEYYQIKEEESNDYIFLRPYGVEIIMNITYDNGHAVSRKNAVRAMFSGRSELFRFMNVLIRNSVTPTTLPEIAKEYILYPVQEKCIK